MKNQRTETRRITLIRDCPAILFPVALSELLHDQKPATHSAIIINTIYMKLSIVAILLLSSSLSFAQSKTDEAAVRKLVDELMLSFTTHDFTTLKVNSTDDVTWVNIVGMWWKGRNEVVGAHYAIFNKIFNGVKFETKELTLRPVSETVILVNAIQHVGAFFPPDGVDHGTNRRPEVDNNLLLLYVKKDGKWLLSTAHNTEVQPGTVPPVIK